MNSTENVLLSKPVNSNLEIIDKDGGLEIVIPAKGIKGKGLISIIVITVWLFTMLVWSIILFMMNPLYVLYSVPFWAIGFITLYKSLNVLRLEQRIIIKNGLISLKLKRGIKYDVKDFPSGVVIQLVEGSYYSYSGLNRRGQYPAIIQNGEAFSFAERVNAKEKAWLISLINYHLSQTI